MTYQYHQIAAQIYRLGRTAAVEVRSETGENAFGNTTDEFVPDRMVIAFKTYPNRNTEVASNIGERSRDHPVFLVPDDENNDPPNHEDALVYENQKYEVKAHTPYDTHVEFFGEPITHGDGSL